MALLITYETEDGEIRTDGWFIGGAVLCESDSVIDVIAEGRELTLIRNAFTNIPMASADNVRWFGDTAKFIAANIDEINATDYA